MKDPYSPNKAFLHLDRLSQYQSGGIPVPVQVHFVISDLCNQNCSFCAYRIDGTTELFAVYDDNGVKNINPDRKIPTNKARQILKELSEAGVKAIQFTGGGEPTVHADCAELMLYANELGMNTALVTNGTNIHKGKLLEAVMKCAWVRVSLDQANEVGYGLMRRTPRVMFKKVLTNIEKIVEAKKETGSLVTIGIGFVVNKENWSEIFNGAVLAKQLGVDNFRISAAFMDEGIDYFREFHLTAFELAKQAEELTREKDK